jgi:DNA-binding CsgD family transcriptional regulator
LIAQITGEVKWFEVAKGLAETVLSLPVVIPWYMNMARAARALVAVGQGDLVAAQEQYAGLKMVPGIKLHYVNTDRVLGLLSLAMGQLDQAATHFEDALAFCRKAGAWPELAWDCYDYADCLLGRNQQDDQQKAISLLEESLAISNELGMRPLMERVLRLRERAESQPARAPAYPDGLTQREVEVLRLVAAGKTDRQIAEELFISVTTASTHVRNLLNKTNTANRTEAAAYAAQHDLI